MQNSTGLLQVSLHTNSSLMIIWLSLPKHNIYGAKTLFRTPESLDSSNIQIPSIGFNRLNAYSGRARLPNHMMKALEVEVLEAITTYSSLYSRRAR
ncbi:hypothetical protein GIB67_022290, partial [Kingdonia uniflora]